MAEQCACARDYEWMPEHYTLAHHPLCGGTGVSLPVSAASRLSPLDDLGVSLMTATGAMIAARAQASDDVAERPRRQRVTLADVEFWERRQGDTVHVTAVLRLATDGAYSVMARDHGYVDVAQALKRELAHRLIRAVYGDVWRLASQVRGEMREAMMGYIPASDAPSPSSELLDMGLADD